MRAMDLLGYRLIDSYSAATLKQTREAKNLQKIVFLPRTRIMPVSLYLQEAANKVAKWGLKENQSAETG